MTLKDLVLLLSTVLLVHREVMGQDDLTVCLEQLGCIRGTWLPGYQLEKFQAFMGIPFAEPPVGPLRFKDPVAKAAFEGGTLNATEPRAFCIQKNYWPTDWPVYGEEDCLYMNIYRPDARRPSGELLPVIFYVHYGGFSICSAHPTLIGPEYFMDSKEVILVAANYRLGPFGFLSTADVNMAGNQGLKDQQLALAWVKRYISNFGGDPMRITLFGNSAGGSSVNYHMLAPKSKGLFHRAILGSGTAVAPFALPITEPYAQVVRLAKAAGIPQPETLDSKGLVEALQAVDARDLLNAGDVFKAWAKHPLVVYKPTIEDKSWPDAFITEHPEKAFDDGAIHVMPLLQTILTSRGEGTTFSLDIWTNETLVKRLNEDFDNVMGILLELPSDIDSTRKSKILDPIVEEYLKGRRELNAETANGFLELFGDQQLVYPFYKLVVKYLPMATRHGTPVYLMKFNHAESRTFISLYGTGEISPDPRPVHLDDLVYLLRTPAMFKTDFDKDSIDARRIKEFVDLYVKFAKFGEIDELAPRCLAEDFDKGNSSGNAICNYLHISAGFQKSKDTEWNLRRMQLWSSIET